MREGLTVVVCSPTHAAEWPLPSPMPFPSLLSPLFRLRKHRHEPALCVLGGEQELEVERAVIEIDET
jgi:hypothetical protein